METLNDPRIVALENEIVALKQQIADLTKLFHTHVHVYRGHNNYKNITNLPIDINAGRGLAAFKAEVSY